MRFDLLVFCFGVVLIAAVGFLSPIWYIGFAPLGVGAIWAAYFLIGAEAGSGAARPPR